MTYQQNWKLKRNNLSLKKKKMDEEWCLIKNAEKFTVIKEVK